MGIRAPGVEASLHERKFLVGNLIQMCTSRLHAHSKTLSNFFSPRHFCRIPILLFNNKPNRMSTAWVRTSYLTTTLPGLSRSKSAIWLPSQIICGNFPTSILKQPSPDGGALWPSTVTGKYWDLKSIFAIFCICRRQQKITKLPILLHSFLGRSISFQPRSWWNLTLLVVLQISSSVSGWSLHVARKISNILLFEYISWRACFLLMQLNIGSVIAWTGMPRERLQR